MSLNPILKSPKSILLYLLFVLAIAVLYINLISLEGKASFNILLVDAIAFNLLIAALGSKFLVFLGLSFNREQSNNKNYFNPLWWWFTNICCMACTRLFCCDKHY